MNRVLGSTVEVVQQNVKWGGEYLDLSSDYTRVLADEDLYTAHSDIHAGTTPTGDLARALGNAGALDLTDSSYAEMVLLYAMGQIRSDIRLSPAYGVRSVDVALKYTGDSIWLRPWGGSASGKWIRFDGMWVVNMTA